MYDFKTFTFGRGAHETREDGMCVMEAVAYVAGEEHSDSPKCASPVIAAFLRSWNDSIPDDDRRRELLAPFVFRLPGTAAGTEIELRRSEMALDWLVREFTPRFLELVPAIGEHARMLRCLPELNTRNFDMAVPIIRAAEAAAWDAARAAAGAAAGAAARDAAWAAAWDAARAAAGAAARAAAGAAAEAAAWDAARAAAGAAAGAAARAAAGAAAGAAAWAAAEAAAGAAAGAAAEAAAGAAAWDAARAAAGAALSPAVTTLQESASRLVDRMIRLTEIQEPACAVQPVVERK